MSESFATVTSGSDTYFQVTDPVSQTTKYRMSGAQVVGITRPGSSTENVTIGYTSGRVSSVTTAAGTVTYGASDSGNVRTVTVKNPLSQTTTYTFDIALQRMRSMIDPLNRTTQWDYDSSGRVTRITQPEQNYTQFSYDARGNVTEQRKVAKPGSGIADVVTSAAYPASCASAVTCNLPTSTTDARGVVTNYTYDPTHGGVTAAVTQNGSGVAPSTQTRYTQVSGIWMATSSWSCRTIASCENNADAVKTSIAYNANLLPTSVTTGTGNGSLTATTTATYTAAGDVLTVDGPLAGAADTTIYSYDAGRRLTAVVGPDPDGPDPLKRRAIVTHYDARGLVDSVTYGTTDANGGSFAGLQYVFPSYDANYWKVAERLSDGSTTFAKTGYGYDAAGRLICIAVRMDPAQWDGQTDNCTPQTNGPNGPDRVTQRGYDAAGQLTAVVTAFGTAAASTETMSYTVNGKTATVTDGNGNVTAYAYDGFDRPWRTCYQTASSTACAGSPADYEQATYAANGDLMSRRLRDGQTIGYGYDALGRLTSKNVPNSVYWETDKGYGYNLIGQLTGAWDSNGRSLGFVYDALGRKISQSDNWYGFGSASFQYDAAGRRTRLTWADGNYVAYDYDVVGAMTAIRENGATSGVGVLARFAYDDRGRRTTLTRGNGTVTGYGFDAASRLTALTQDLAGTANDQTLGFTYNPAGQIATRGSSNDGYAFTGTYNVDRSYGVNGLNQLTSAGATALGYDARGNLTGSGSSSYSYTSENRLAIAPGANLAYDPLDRLFNVNAESGVNTTLLYDGADVIAEVEQNNGAAALRRYVHGPGNDEPLIWYEGAGLGDRRWLHADERGTVVAVTNTAGAALAINRYDEYGIPAAGNLGRFQYTGQKWLPAVGLYDYKARMYSPTLGRFMQTDPIGYGDGLNWYNYVGSDPVNFTDPSGLDTQPAPAPPIGPDIVVTAESKCRAAGGRWQGACYFYSASNRSWYPQPVDSSSDGPTGFIPDEPQSVADGVGTVTQSVVDDIVVTARRTAQTLRRSATITVNALDRSLDIVHDLILPPACCFTAGTLVSTPAGLKAIETLKVGDLVVSRSDKTGDTAAKPIVRITPAHERRIWAVTVSYKGEDGRWTDERYETTDDHPWRTADTQWVTSASLKQGQLLVRENGTAIVAAVADTQSTKLTYNLEIADFHTYFVGKSETWVHNSCVYPSTSPVWKGLTPWRGKVRTDGNKYYGWDYTHQNIEVYNGRGAHLGVMDPMSGDMIGGAVYGRTINVR